MKKAFLILLVSGLGMSPCQAEDCATQGKELSSYRIADLFAGIGGIRLGYEQSRRCKCVFTSEWDKKCQETYSANWPNETIHGDICKIDPITIPDFDILCAGFPCQPFSTIGKREGFEHKTQGTLFFYIAKILDVKKPRAFFLENVPGLISHDKGKTLKTILDVLRHDLKYDVDYCVLDAADFGVPQHRKRIYIVGFRNDLNICTVGQSKTNRVASSGYCFTFPKGSYRDHHVGIGRYIEKDADGPSISINLQTNYLFKVNDGRPQIVDEHSDFPVKTLCASYHKIQRLTGTFVRGGSTGIRMFTEKECKAIQGFPSDFKVPVSRTNMYHQFGNAVAVPVIASVATNVVRALDWSQDVKEGSPSKQ